MKRDPERLTAIEEHRQRIEREMAELPEQEQLSDPFSGFRRVRDFSKPRRSSRSDCKVLLARLDRFNLMARNPGWSM